MKRGHLMIMIIVLSIILIGIVKVSPLHRDAKEICNWYDKQTVFHVGNDSVLEKYYDYKQHEVLYRAYALDVKWFFNL